MQLKNKEILEDLVSENMSKVGALSGSVITLDALQSEVSNLMEKVDLAIFNGCFESSYIANVAIKEIEQRLRVIDMAFRHTNLDIQKEVTELEISAEQLRDITMKTKKAPAVTGAV